MEQLEIELRNQELENEVRGKIIVLEDLVQIRFPGLDSFATDVRVRPSHLDNMYNIEGWEKIQLYGVLLEALSGLEYFARRSLKNGAGFPLGNLNNFKLVLDGSEKILFVNKKSIRHFNGVHCH